MWKHESAPAGLPRKSRRHGKPGNDMPCFIEWGANWVRNLQNWCPLATFWGSFCLFALKKQFVLHTPKKLSPLCSIDSLVRSLEKHLFSVSRRFFPLGVSGSNSLAAFSCRRVPATTRVGHCYLVPVLRFSLHFRHSFGFVLPFLRSKTSSFWAFKKVQSFVFNNLLASLVLF